MTSASCCPLLGGICLITAKYKHYPIFKGIKLPYFEREHLRDDQPHHGSEANLLNGKVGVGMIGVRTWLKAGYRSADIHQLHREVGHVGVTPQSVHLTNNFFSLGVSAKQSTRYQTSFEMNKRLIESVIIHRSK